VKSIRPKLSEDPSSIVQLEHLIERLRVANPDVSWKLYCRSPITYLIRSEAQSAPESRRRFHMSRDERESDQLVVGQRRGVLDLLVEATFYRATDIPDDQVAAPLFKLERDHRTPNNRGKLPLPIQGDLSEHADR
jgi:hypothetical protein